MLGTNYWEMVNVYGGYFWMGALGVASITQLLAIFGIANELNLMVWIYGLEMAGGLLGFISMIVMFYAYDSAYAVTVDTSKTTAEQTNGQTVMDGIWADFVKGTLNSIITQGAIMMASEPWYRWNMEMAGLEMDDKEGRKGDKDGEMHDGEMHDGEKRPKPDQLMTKFVKYFSF